MISIFSKDLEDDTRRRDTYLERLKEPGEMAQPDSKREENGPQVIALTDGRPAGGALANGDATAPRFVPAVVEARPGLARAAAEPDQRASQNGAGQVAGAAAQQLTDALASMMREMQGLSSPDMTGIQSTLQSVSEETDRVSEGLKRLRQDVDEAIQRSRSGASFEERANEALKTLSAGVDQLRRVADAHTDAASTQSREILQLRQEMKQQSEAGSTDIKGKIEPMEQSLLSLREVVDHAQKASSTVAERFAALERRLDSQAEAIKALHTATQGFGARQEILQDLLQKLVGGESAVKPLPDSL